MKHERGFTLIELVLVIAILAILAISALPRFLDISIDAKQASRDGVIGAIRAGIALYKADEMVTLGAGTGTYPSTLDAASNTNCGTTNRCFTTVIPNGIEDPAWTRISDTSYSFNDGATTTTYTYSPTTGTFQ
jgi:MSHA pilin protein MshA